jgi:hypothetical protein
MRSPKFAGSFYPSSREEISKFVEGAVDRADLKTKGKEIGKAYSYVAPHAGYEYSGGTAAFTYKAMTLNERIKDVETVLVIGPNHTGFGKPISVSLDDWKTPVGVSENDRELSKAISSVSRYIELNEEAHAEEHSIEVQLPFLQLLEPGKRVSMICMGDQDLEASRLLSDAILVAVKKINRKIIVVASSDFNHYESGEAAKRKDTQLLDAASKLDYERFNSLIDSLQDSACGFGPITVAMMFAKGMGASRGVLLKYSNSGDQTGDYSSVVAYSSIAFV